jgi:hypothetical protein
MKFISITDGIVSTLFAAVALIVFASAASALICSSPYTKVASVQTGDVCTSTCAPGSFPALDDGGITCKPGYATAICPEGNEFMVMTPVGPVCQQGYVPVASTNHSIACNPGDLRVERPPYQLNGSLIYETCASGPNCPAGYFETVDPDNALGSSRVCMLPCQDFVMNQSMACSCASGGRVGTQEPGAPVKQICQPSCPADSQWVASSPLYAFKAEEGQCIPSGGGQPLALSDVSPFCPGATYWTGQVCLPIGGGGGGDMPILMFGSCPGGTHWNGSHCVPDFIPFPICGSGMHWNGLFCVPNAPKPCPIFMKWDGFKCVPIFQQLCSPNQYWDGTTCVPKLIVCLPPKKWVDGQCIFVPYQMCLPPKKWINGQCVLPLQKICPPPNQWVNGQCVPPLPQLFCLPPMRWINGQCVLAPPQQICAPPKKWINGQCVLPLKQICPPPKKWINGKCVSDVT